MDIGFALRTIAENGEFTAVLPQFANEIIPDPMRLPRPHDMANRKSRAPKLETFGIGTEKRFSGQLARSIGRNGL